MTIDFEIIGNLLAVRGGACLGWIHHLHFTPAGVLVDFTDSNGDPSEVILNPERIMVA